jgi:2,3-bisphosphoglycerate-dependent phosphoglycerate mutase/probable phosphoglycerate mutase
VIEQLILVRHAETEHNVAGIAQGWGDSALSERGARQTRALAARVAGLAPNALFSSPLQRAMTMAGAVAETTGLEIVVLDDLREINLGRWEGQSYLEVRRTDAEGTRRWRDDPDFACPGGESHNDLLRRMNSTFRTIEEHANGRPTRAVVVTHGTALRVAATILLAVPILTSRHLAQDNAAINIFERRGSRWVLKLWNDTTHCEP